MSSKMIPMHPGQERLAVNQVAQPSASIPIESTERYLYEMAMDDSVEKAEQCFEMLRDLYIDEEVWRDREAEIRKNLKEIKRRKLEDEEKKKTLDLERMASLLANMVKPSQIAVEGDYVVEKHVENEVGNVAEGATGVNINKKTHDTGRETETDGSHR